MANEPDKKDSNKTITERLGINEETDQDALSDSTGNDGSEDLGAELDIEFRKN